MRIKIPQDDEKFHWTKHSLEKMFYYRISAAKVKNIVFRPRRREEGIAPETIAVMQAGGSQKRPYETWVMYQIKNLPRSETNFCSVVKNSRTRTSLVWGRKKAKIIIIISTWKYPGISHPGQPIPIPEDIREELGINDN